MAYARLVSSGDGGCLLVPTAVNQQKFLFMLMEDGRLSAQPGHVSYVKMDLGITKYHFEIGAVKDSFQWVKRLRRKRRSNEHR